MGYLDLAHSLQRRQSALGFTVVELLIAIVIIGILAALVIVAYVGIQNKAYDSAVQSDLEGIGKQIALYSAQTGTWPYTFDQNPMNPPVQLKVTKSAYSSGLDVSGAYFNVVVCWPTPATNSTGFAIIAQSKSGNVFENKNGSIDKATYAFDHSNVICPAAGVTIDTYNSSGDGGRDWLYNSSSWGSQVAG